MEDIKVSHCSASSLSQCIKQNACQLHHSHSAMHGLRYAACGGEVGVRGQRASRPLEHGVHVSMSECAQYLFCYEALPFLSVVVAYPERKQSQWVDRVPEQLNVSFHWHILATESKRLPSYAMQVEGKQWTISHGFAVTIKTAVTMANAVLTT